MSSLEAAELLPDARSDLSAASSRRFNCAISSSCAWVFAAKACRFLYRWRSIDSPRTLGLNTHLLLFLPREDSMYSQAMPSLWQRCADMHTHWRGSEISDSLIAYQTPGVRAAVLTLPALCFDCEGPESAGRPSKGERHAHHYGIPSMPQLQASTGP